MFVSIWRILDRHMRRRLLLLPVLLLIGGLLEGIGIGLFLPLLQVISTPDGIHDIPWIAKLYELSGTSDTSGFLLSLLVILFGVILLKSAYFVLLTYYQQNFIWTSRSITTGKLLRYYLSAPYVFHLRHNSATLLRNTTQSIQEIFVATLLPLVAILTEAVVVLVIYALLASVDPQATLLVTVMLCVPMGLFYAAIRRPLKQWGATTQRTQSAIIQTIQQSLTCIREIKVLGREEYFLDLFSRAITLNSRSRLRYQVVNDLSKNLLEVIAVLIFSATLLMFILSDRPLTQAIPTLGLFAVAAFRLMPSLNRIAGQLQALRFGSAAFDVLYEDIRNIRATPNDQARRAETVGELGFSDVLELDNVAFRYDDQNREILSGISLRIRRGESVAFVGASGAGKSTLAAIVMGLLTPTSGEIRVDGQNIGAENITAWRKHLGFIPQEVAILDDTLKQNIAFGIPAGEIDPSRLDIAIDSAALRDVVCDLPVGYETVLGERGTRLSGGQRQRVGIARALYLNADILILDEATSALDAETESEISDAIRRLHGEKTLLIIAHRLSTVQDCDRIYFMQNGRIVDQGTFEQLKIRNTSFKSMVDKMTLAEPA